MTKLPALKAKEAISALEKLGFQMDHVTQSLHPAPSGWPPGSDSLPREQGR